MCLLNCCDKGDEYVDDVDHHAFFCKHNDRPGLTHLSFEVHDIDDVFWFAPSKPFASRRRAVIVMACFLLRGSRSRFYSSADGSGYGRPFMNVWTVMIGGKPIACCGNLGLEEATLLVESVAFRSELMRYESESGLLPWDGKVSLSLRAATEEERRAWGLSYRYAIDSDRVHEGENWTCFLESVSEIE